MDPESKPLKKRSPRKKSLNISDEMADILKDDGLGAQKIEVKKAKKISKPRSKKVTVKPIEQEDFSKKEVVYKEFFAKPGGREDILPELHSNTLTDDNEAFVESSKIEKLLDINPKTTYDDFEEKSFKVKPLWKKTFKFICRLGLLSVAGYFGYWYAIQKGAMEVKVEKNLSDIVVLPEDEAPQIYKISPNAEILKNPLFTKATTGDMVYFFPNNAEIYIYRPEIEKLVSVILPGQVISTSTTQNSTSTPIATATTSTSTAKVTKATTSKDSVKK